MEISERPGSPTCALVAVQHLREGNLQAALDALAGSGNPTVRAMAWEIENHMERQQIATDRITPTEP